MKNRWRVDFLVLLLLAGFFGVLSADPASAASKFEPPDGQILTGVTADQQNGDTAETSKAKWDEWTKLMGGKPAAISHTFEGFDMWANYDCGLARARNATPLITWQTDQTTPRDIAQAGATPWGARTDEMLLRNGWLLATHADCKDRPAFVRIDQEMNAHWFPWSSYNADGSQRPSGPDDFRDMWKRMVVVLRGGKVADVNARLAAEGLPPLDPQARMPSWMNLPSTTDPNGVLPSASNVAFVWNPYDAPGWPDVAGNRWADYYPGDEYVDWVGQTTYNTVWNTGAGSTPKAPVPGTIDKRFEWMDAFYQEFSVGHGKPYMMGEWGLESAPGYGSPDNPAYIDRVLKWAEGKPEVKALISFDNGRHKLAGADTAYPNSAAALSAGLKGERYLGDLTSVDSGPSYAVQSRDAQLTFSSPEIASGLKFECSLDGAAFAACSSPASYSGLADGLHVFKVRTTDGTTPGEPAVRSWNVAVPKATTTTIASAATQVTYPGSTTVSGRLVTQDGQALSGKTVTVERRPVGSTAFSGVNVATTDANGNWSMDSGAIPVNSDYRARYAGDAAT